MKFRNYEIRNYQNEFLLQVARLQKYLWGGNLEENISFFKWKYEENPYTENPIGIIAFQKDDVIGFKSFYPTRWEIGNKGNKFMMLSPTDTVIHPDHRRKGLFTAMTKMSMKIYKGTQYKTFINLSSNEYTAAGNLKLGWLPVHSITFLRKYNFAGLINYFLIKKTKFKLNKSNITFGKFGNIEVTDKPKVEEMCSVIQKQEQTIGKIRLYKDTEYLKYRFRNPRKRYIFYYFWNNGKITGYLIIKTLKRNNNVHILDYAQSKSTAIQEILRHIINSKYYDMISIWNIDLENELLQTLKRLHFNTNPIYGKIENMLRGSQYLLIRPIRKEFTEEDWFVQGVDSRNIENWAINEFCYDPD